MCGGEIHHRWHEHYIKSKVRHETYMGRGRHSSHGRDSVIGLGPNCCLLLIIFTLIYVKVNYQTTRSSSPPPPPKIGWPVYATGYNLFYSLKVLTRKAFLYLSKICSSKLDIIFNIVSPLKSTGQDRSWTGDYAACGRCHLAHAAGFAHGPYLLPSHDGSIPHEPA